MWLLSPLTYRLYTWGIDFTADAKSSPHCLRLSKLPVMCPTTNHTVCLSNCSRSIFAKLYLLNSGLFLQYFVSTVYWIENERKGLISLEICCFAIWTVAKVDLFWSGRTLFDSDRFGCHSNRKGMSFVFNLFVNVLEHFRWADNCFLAYCSCSFPCVRK